MLVVNGDARKEPFNFDYLGFGVFETFSLRSHLEGKEIVAVGFDRHIARLLQGASKLRLAVPRPDHIENALAKCLHGFDWSRSKSAIARIVVTDSSWIVQVDAFQDKKKEFRLLTMQMQRQLPEIKSCSAAVSVLSQKLAQEGQADEALLVNPDNKVKEASWSNFFWLDKDLKIRTPESGILKGVTRSIVLELNEIIPTDCSLEELKMNIKGAFITSSLKGVCNVMSIDELQFLGEGSQQIKAISRAYEQLYSAADPKFCRVFSL